jgi:hypothetical protein
MLLGMLRLPCRGDEEHSGRCNLRDLVRGRDIGDYHHRLAGVQTKPATHPDWVYPADLGRGNRVKSDNKSRLQNNRKIRALPCGHTIRPQHIFAARAQGGTLGRPSIGTAHW